MKSNRKWKTMLGYLSGCLILAGVMILAWFVPGWYSQWKDEQRMGQVMLMNRENIQFINTDRLDFVGRLKLLQASENGKVFGEHYLEWMEGGYVSTTEEMWRSRIEQWVEAGLLPKEAETVLDTWSIWVWAQYYVYPGGEGTLLPVEVLQFRNADNYFDGAMTFVVDAENGMIYYVSISGPYFYDALAAEIGFSTAGELWEAVASGVDWEISQDFPGYETKFASVGGADLAEVSVGTAELDLEVTLHYDDFAGYACRRAVDNNTGWGLAYMFGTRSWGGFISQVLARTVYTEYNENLEYEYICYAGDWADRIRSSEYPEAEIDPELAASYDAMSMSGNGEMLEEGK